MQFVVFFTLFMVLMMTVTSVGASPKDNLQVTLASAQQEYKTSQDVIITVSISNPTGHSMRILKWFTPANGLEEPLFKVSVNGRTVSYAGAIYKRPAPTGNDYLTLKSGQSVSYSVNLGEYYDLAESGDYTIFFSAASYNLFDEKVNTQKQPDLLESEVISFKVEGRPGKKPTPSPTPPPSGNTTFTSCTAAQQTTLLNAREQAKTYASTSEIYLFNITSGTTRYLEWFGLYTSTRHNLVKDHFTALSDAWDTAVVNFNCSCKQNYYAYVYPNKPYNIYLCRVFWSAPMTGTDSKAGTLIHEMSHFYVVASTDDYVYGQTGASSLADTNPDQAVMNADNHEYFAENNPYLP